MTTPSIKKTGPVQGEIPEMPINADWILEGKPQARGTVLLQSPDQKLSSGFWSCTAGRFNWIFSWDEFVHILEGEVSITQENGPTITLKAGDSAHFPCGAKTEWLVPKYVRKFFTLRTSEPFVL
ncbi:MAG: cupin domain-containing protein [Planctomycetaceae bacterium]